MEPGPAIEVECLTAELELADCLAHGGER
jgi:hypothetical protein